MKTARLILVFAAIAGLIGCSNEDEDEFAKYSPDQIYYLGEQEVLDGDLIDGAETFLEIERLYPYSEWARRGTIMAAYLYNQAGEFEKSRGVAERFLSFYPAGDDAAYAQYLIALSFYENIDEKGRDQANTIESLESLQAVMENYGESEYAKSAAMKFDLAVDHLAAKEMEVGRYYLKHKHYGAAIKRFQLVVNDYSTTSYVPEALHRLVEAYLSLGLVDEAFEAAAVLGYNYQGSEWYEETFELFNRRGFSAPTREQSESLARKVYRQTIKGDWL